MSSGVNLIPSGSVASVRTQQRAGYWAAACGLVIIGVLTGYFLIRGRAQRMDLEVQQLRVQVASMAHWEQDIAPLVTSLKTASAQWQAAEQLVGQPDWPGLLAELAVAAGNDVLITEVIAMSEQGPANTKNSAAVTVSGLADDSGKLVGFMDRLSNAPKVKEFGLNMSRQVKDAADGSSLEFKLRLMPH